MESRVRALTSNTDPEGAKLNVPPGTVIDHEITNPNCFYFISHKTLMGTTKPAKYTIVDDEIRFKADNLLAVVYQLCRLMPQTKRSYRRPIPIGLTEKVLKWCVMVEPNIYDEQGCAIPIFFPTIPIFDTSILPKIDSIPILDIRYH